MRWSDFIERAITVPFVERGRDYCGWDCWGVAQLAYRDVLGIEIPSYLDAYETTSEHRAIYRAFAAGKTAWKRVDQPAAGDLALILRRNLPIHVGVVLEDDRLLHAEANVGTVIEPMDRLRIEGFYRYRRPPYPSRRPSGSRR